MSYRSLFRAVSASAQRVPALRTGTRLLAARPLTVVASAVAVRSFHTSRPVRAHPAVWAALLVKKIAIFQVAKVYGIPRLYRRILELDRRLAPGIVRFTPFYNPQLPATAQADGSARHPLVPVLVPVRHPPSNDTASARSAVAAHRRNVRSGLRSLFVAPNTAVNVLERNTGLLHLLSEYEKSISSNPSLIGAIVLTALKATPIYGMVKEFQALNTAVVINDSTTATPKERVAASAASSASVSIPASTAPSSSADAAPRK